METTNVTLDQFKAHLDGDKIDWLYYLSDDPKVFWNGERQQQELETAASLIGKTAVDYLASKRKIKWNLNK